MKRLLVIGLGCLFAACQSSPAPLLEGQPEKAATYPTKAADLSDCVYRFSQTIRSPYLFRRDVRANNREFLVTGIAASTIRLPTIELRFITQGETTTVEMRENAVGDHELTRNLWAIVERCSQPKPAPSASKSTAP